MNLLQHLLSEKTGIVPLPSPIDDSLRFADRCLKRPFFAPIAFLVQTVNREPLSALILNIGALGKSETGKTKYQRVVTSDTMLLERTNCELQAVVFLSIPSP